MVVIISKKLGGSYAKFSHYSILAISSGIGYPIEKNWKSSFVDAVGVIAVVVSVLFVAYELHQANTLATTNVTYDLMQQHNELQFLVMSNPEMARLVGLAEVDAKIDSSSTEFVQLRSLTWQQHNAWTQAHIAW